MGRTASLVRMVVSEHIVRTPSASLLRRLRRSPRFIKWGKLTLADLEQSAVSVAEKHYTPQELAEAWGVSAESVRQIFREEPGVLKIGKTGAKYKRGYVTLRIPESVAERVHTRLSA
jgi:hypothetical protein